MKHEETEMGGVDIRLPIITPQQFANLKITDSKKQNFVLITTNPEVLEAYEKLFKRRR